MKKKVLILSVPPPYGGGEIRAKQLSKYFSQYSEFVIIENSNKSKNKSNQGKISISNVFINIRYIIRNVLTIVKNRPALVYMSIPKNFIPLLKVLPVLLTTKLFGGKVVGELAGRNFYFLETKGMSYSLGLKILRLFNSIRVLGESVKSTLKTYGLNRNIVIDNGVDIPNQNKNSVKSINASSRITIGFVGALHEKKGIYILTEIANLLKTNNVNFTLEIAGEWGNDKDKMDIQSYIKKNNLKNNIKFLGLIHNETKWEFYKRIDIFILPSYNEGQPLVLIEAMAFGIPIICSGVGAIPDTVNSGYNGFIIEEFLAKKYVAKIKKLLEDKLLYEKVSSNNLNTFAERFRVENYFENIHTWINANSDNKCNNSHKN
ncbi:glycosyltransferase family 4 protein [uncultured Winogradskyella sp.]|uniref:glycosyltransferase family 4 protein n=1 Tax=uncultured Winogradskyella sp. TaxID=395353 RepID=UPI00262537B3|nr:glycosyltransferase family 4 protein [uncultured Winogradskyella sp.]